MRVNRTESACQACFASFVLSQRYTWFRSLTAWHYGFHSLEIWHYSILVVLLRDQRLGDVRRQV